LQMARRESAECRAIDAITAIGGTSLRVYMYLLARGGEVGVRELQRALGFKSPSTAKHHLDRLVELGLAEKGFEGYRVVASSELFRASLRGLLNKLVPMELLFGVYGAAALLAYFAFYGLRETLSAAPLALALFVLTSFLVYRGIRLYKWYQWLSRGGCES